MKQLIVAMVATLVGLGSAQAGHWHGDDYDDGYYSYRYYGYSAYRPDWYGPRVFVVPGYYRWESYAVPRYRPYPVYRPRVRYYDTRDAWYGDCEVKRKWRRGRYWAKVDCD